MRAWSGRHSTHELEFLDEIPRIAEASDLQEMEEQLIQDRWIISSSGV